jgi:hypothetical protein
MISGAAPWVALPGIALRIVLEIGRIGTMDRYAVVAFGLGFALATSGALAQATQNKLPTELAGSGMYSGTNRAVVSPWSIVIESQSSDGAILGKMSFGGVRCQFKDLAFTGLYKGGTLEISAPETSPTCGAWKISMSQPNAAKFEFEGTATIGEGTIRVNLKPRQ